MMKFTPGEAAVHAGMLASVSRYGGGPRTAQGSRSDGSQRRATSFPQTDVELFVLGQHGRERNQAGIAKAILSECNQ